MRISCECGNEAKIVKSGDSTFYESEHAELELNFDIHAEHDELWITCTNCKKSYHLFT
jgi:hypothetical protein